MSKEKHDNYSSEPPSPYNEADWAALSPKLRSRLVEAPAASSSKETNKDIKDQLAELWLSMSRKDRIERDETRDLMAGLITDVEAQAEQRGYDRGRREGELVALRAARKAADGVAHLVDEDYKASLDMAILRREAQLDPKPEEAGDKPAA